jgi:hypothetical protein
MLLLVTINHYDVPGGSETWTYATITNLKHMGHNVDLYVYKNINNNSMLVNKTKEYGIDIYCGDNIPKKDYDLIFANHTSTINKIKDFYKSTKIIQTCHGVYPKLEQPVKHLYKYISVSNEIYKHLEKRGIQSTVITNGIDCERFTPKIPINDKLINVLSLAQDRQANLNISNVCKELNLNLSIFHKRINGVFNIEDKINEADLVISIGRGVYESLACGRNVISYDSRNYYTLTPMGHVLLKNDNDISTALIDNFTGRNDKKYMSNQDLKNEFLKYKKEYGEIGREYILNNCNIKNQLKKYLLLKN